MGPQGSITQIHHDFTDNLFVMVRGRKRVRLFDPYQEASFYLFPFKTLNGRSSWHLAQTPSATDPDFQRFPKFNGVTYQEVVMEPGNLLLIPNFWWHEVESLDQPSISLAYWWSDRTRSEIDGTIEKITGFAEDLAQLPLGWKKLVHAPACWPASPEPVARTGHDNAAGRDLTKSTNNTTLVWSVRFQVVAATNTNYNGQRGAPSNPDGRRKSYERLDRSSSSLP